ncbi:D-2-hydroxyacid dehydrogenase [Radiobacillus sp. PE A8.2]|uniref:D-2-hydroxyacid dehydrogenase n=1 Tax=Radiobacillus sp. PE A8.2 TaxID=3380349 RepID=UPI003890B3A8
MKSKKIIVAENLNNQLQTKIKEAVPNWEIIFGKNRDNWNHHLQEAHIIAGWKKAMEEPCLQQTSQLQWIQSWSAGVDNYPLQLIADNSIHLTTASGVHSYPISETIFALMLGWTRKIDTYVRNKTNKIWDHGNLKLEIHQKTIGIIGVGAIGKETAKIAKAFDMKVIGVRNTNKPEPFVDEMVTIDQLHDILPSCDFVVLTLPLTEQTNHLFGKDEFKLMKHSSFLINIGRGEVVNEQALIEALQNEEIAGAGLDVFENEPLEKTSPLWEMENVIITPHTAGSTEYYDQRVVENILIPNLRSYINGQPPSINLVDFKKQY